MKSIQIEAEKRAEATVLQLAAVVRRVYDNNLSDSPDEKLRAGLDAEMKELVWQVLLVKGDSMWAAFRVLSLEQKQRVRAEIAKPRQPGDLPDVTEVIAKMFKLGPK